MAGARPSLPYRLLAALAPFAGGVLVGTGGVLLAQVRFARYVRDEVDRIGPFTRFFGRVSFLWRSTDEKLALAFSDVPEEYLEYTHHVGVCLIVVGFPFVALIAPWVLRRGRRRASS